MELVALLAAPFLAAALAVGSRAGSRALGAVSGALAALLTLALARAAPAVLEGAAPSVSLAWAPALGLRFALRLDGLSLLFALLVTGVGAAVLIYSGGYLRGHRRPGPFFAALLLFLGAMLGLVLADDLLLLCACFELTALASWLLIAWEREREGRRAALQALLLTHAGGLCLLVAALWIERRTGTFQVSALPALRGRLEGAPGAGALALLLVAAASKSALAPLQVWLPNAMRAPTPVSAYLHSAAMVKAGVFVLARLAPVFSGLPLWGWGLGVLGASTVLLGAAVTLRAIDLKRILAGSTVLTLGLLTLALGVGGEVGALAFVGFAAAHALYKAALFMTSGAIERLTGSRDVRRLGGLGRRAPALAVAAALAGAALAGLPPTAGFQGKELIYEAALGAPEAALLAAVCALGGVALAAAAWTVAVRPFLGPAPPSAGAERARGARAWLIGPPLALGVLVVLAAAAPAWRALLAAAAGAVLGEPVTHAAPVWPSPSGASALGAVALVGGVAAAARWDRLRRTALVRWADRAAVALPDRLYERALDRLERAAGALLTRWERVTLRREVVLLAVCLLLGVGAPALVAGASGWPRVGPFAPLDVVIVGAVVVAAIGAARARGRFGAVIALGAVGYAMALLFLRCGAPDVALAQVAVETVVAVLFAIVLVDLPGARRRSGRVWDATLAAATGALVLVLALAALARPLDRSLAVAYSRGAVPLGHGHNVINVILVDFRAFDTIGEVATLLGAGLAAHALARRGGPSP